MNLKTPLAAFCTLTIFAAQSALGQTSSIVAGTGDTTASSTVLIARLTAPGPAFTLLSTDPSFPTGQTQLSFDLVPDALVPLKRTFDGLEAGTRYHYLVVDSTFVPALGTFVTPHEPGARHGLRFGASGDWQQAPGYAALSNVASAELDFFIKLGDTIYADTETPGLPGIGQARTLDDFRIKQNESISGRFGRNFMQSLYASTTLYQTIDDHELVDNFAGGALPSDSPDAPDVNPAEPPLFTDSVPFVNETQAYRDAIQAYREYHPTEEGVWLSPFDPRMDGKPRLYRERRFGDDAALMILDTRSFRDVQLPPVADPTDLAAVLDFLEESFTPGRTLLGRRQLVTLLLDLQRAQLDGVTWKFVVVPEPIQNFGVVTAEDRFEGYAYERSIVLGFIQRFGIDNVVFLAADFHGSLVNNLAYQVLLPVGPGGVLVPISVPIQAFEIVHGPVAFFEGRFGPAVVNIAAAAGIISPQEVAFYDSLPIAVDGDDVADDKDDFIKQLINAQLVPLDYDPMGLNANVPGADGLIDATLITGDYVSTHQYTWNEYEIDATTQELTVTTWGVDAYSEDQQVADPDAALDQTPEVVTRFTVRPR